MTDLGYDPFDYEIAPAEVAREWVEQLAVVLYGDGANADRLRSRPSPRLIREQREEHRRDLERARRRRVGERDWFASQWVIEIPAEAGTVIASLPEAA